MGRRSINTTKSGKYMNPTDQARKEARKRELKKNKKQRMMVRQAVLKGKDPYKLLEDMEQIDKMEYDPTQPPKLNEKVLKDKRKKLRETFDRVFRLYEKEDPSFAVEIRKAESEYNSKRSEMQAYYEQVRLAEQVQLDQIPLPDAPSIQPIPSQIPLPLDVPLGVPPSKTPAHGILKKPQSVKAPPLPPLSVLRKRKAPGPPPGPPPALSDDEDEKEAALVPENTNGKAADVIEAPVPDIEKPPPAKQRKIRFEDDDKYDPEDPEKDTRPKYKPAVSPLQVRMLQMAGQVVPMVAVPEDKGLTAPGVPPVAEKMEVDQDEVDKLLEDIKAAKENPVPLSAPGTKAVSETISTPLSTPGGSATMPPGAPPGPPPGLPPGPPPGLPPMLFRPPPLRGAPPGAPRMLPPGPPPGRPPGIPPGPPPGLPPNLRAPPPRLPSGPPGVPPPRLMRPPQVPPPGIHPPSVPTSAASNPNVLSAPPSIMKPLLKSDEDKKKGGATIEAKPQIKNLIGDVTRFMPTALRVKRNQQKGRPGKDDMASLKPSPTVAPQTKDDAYENFLKEMQGLL